LKNILDGNLLNTQLLISPPNQINTIFFIPIQAKYKMKLEFSSLDKGNLDNFQKNKIDIPIRWDFYSLGILPPYFATQQTLINNGEGLTDGLWISDKQGFSKELRNSEVFLKPGYYRLNAAVREAVPEFANIPAHILIHVDNNYAFEHYFGIDFTLGIAFWVLVVIDISLGVFIYKIEISDITK
jgi:hypothetical protein